MRSSTRAIKPSRRLRKKQATRNKRSEGAAEVPQSSDKSAGSHAREAISLNGLSKRYGESVLAVDNLSLRVEQGQVFGLLGPNGAGKTTALRMLLGLVHPTAGFAEIFGERVRPGAVILRRVGALVEGPAFVPHLSGIDNLRTRWEPGGRPMAEANPAQALGLPGLGS